MQERKLGYLKDNMIYEGVTRGKQNCGFVPLANSISNAKFEDLLSAAVKIDAIGFPEGHEGVVEYEKKLHWGKWIAIPAPEKEASTQPVEELYIKVGHNLIKKIDRNLLAESSFDVDFEGEVMVRIEPANGEYFVVNAVNGYGENCRDKYKHEKVTFLTQMPEPTSALPDKQESGNALRNFIDSFVADKSLKYGLACSMVADMARLGIDITDEQQQEYQDKYAEDVVDEILDDMLSKLQSAPSTKETGQREAIGVWLRQKPEFNRECTFVTATEHIKNKEVQHVDYSVWQIQKLDGENEEGEPAWYWGLLNGDNEEWGPLEDLHAKWYFILPGIQPSDIKPV